MPIDPSNYPANWPSFSLHIRHGRARDRCECRGECGTDHGGRCRAINGQRKFYTVGGSVIFSTVWLSTGHLWKDACSCEERCAIASHVKAFCQRCHLKFDVEMRVEHARATRQARKDARRPLLVGVE
jgi:hypothetical protein